MGLQGAVTLISNGATLPLDEGDVDLSAQN